MSLASWYSQQYSPWNRTRRLQQSQFLAHTDTNASRAATAMAQNGQAGMPSTNVLAASPDTIAPNPNKDKKATDPLFGPNIGPTSAGPTWTTTASRKKLITDDLTPEVLTSWVEKSKQPGQPTTTLQALVNLKRPTLRLSPLSSVPEDSQSPLDPQHQHLHGLEFEYDCDAPKCSIYVHVVLSKTHPEAAAIPSASNQAQILVFESVTSGGFGKRLTLEEGALLELGRFDHVPQPLTSSDPPLDEPVKSESATDVASVPSAPGEAGASNRPSRRRFTQHFHFRKRSHNRSVAGPALAVVDAEPAPAQDAKKDRDKEEQEGIRVIIRLAALDEQGTELASPNEQTTFLHIVRLGTRSNTPGEDGEIEDNRPWVVKVVKREATIGPHTFQLHEIYGLTSSANVQATANGTDPHTYPPAAAADDEDPSSECLLCLSSSREVVLIPCRHLVACKECALNMVEFGAGGNITHTPESAPATNAAETAEATGGLATGATEGGATTAPAPASPTVPLTAARRKRKAKGWFCPVCRQPYTSLLRITTAPPPAPEKEVEGNVTDEDHTQRAPADMTGDNRTAGAETTETRPGGLLGNTFSRPGFLRGISFNNRGGNPTPPPPPPPPADVESQAGLGRPGA